MEITVAKAFKVRKQMKEWLAANAKPNGFEVSKNMPYDGYAEAAAELRDKIVKEKLRAFDGKTYDEQLDYIFSTMEQLEKLNEAIEDSNNKVHKLLMQETALKSKLATVSYLANCQKSIPDNDEDCVFIEKEMLGDGRYEKHTFVKIYANRSNRNWSDEEQKIKKEINKIRDEITYLDASQKIKVDFLDETWL